MTEQSLERHAGDARKRVLLAEDDPEMRELIRLAMCREGYEVVEVPDGNQLLLCLEALAMKVPGAPRPDVIVSDVRMPGHSGLDLLAAMREARADFPAIPVVLITAFSDAATRDRARQLDAVLLDKPFDIDDLRGVVRSIISRC